MKFLTLLTLTVLCITLSSGDLFKRIKKSKRPQTEDQKLIASLKEQYNDPYQVLQAFNAIKNQKRSVSDNEPLPESGLELQPDVGSDIESDDESVADEEDVVSEVGSEDDVADDASDAASVNLEEHEDQETNNFDDLFKENPIEHEEPEAVVEPEVKSTPDSPLDSPRYPRSPKSPKLLLDTWDENTREKLYKTGNEKLWD